MVSLKRFSCGPFSTNSYRLGCMETGKGAFIDPAVDSAEVLIEAAIGYKIEAIFLTHSHWDHIGDLKKIKESFNVPVYVHGADIENVRNPGSDGLPLPFAIEGVEPDFALSDKQSIDIGHLKLHIIHTPGHTPGGICIYLKTEKILISGDTLFKGSIGNLSFPTANQEDMWKSLKILENLPLETSVYPGHGLPTTIGNEKWLSQAKNLFS